MKFKSVTKIGGKISNAHSILTKGFKTQCDDNSKYTLKILCTCIIRTLDMNIYNMSYKMEVYKL